MGSGASTKYARYDATLDELTEGANSDKEKAKLKKKLMKEFESKLDEKLAQEKNTNDPAAALVKKLGGDSKIKELKSNSRKLIASINASLPQDPSFQQQPLIYEGTGLAKLLADGREVKKEFDKGCQKVCDTWSEKFKLQCEFQAAPVKGMARAEVKVRVEMNGRTTQLKDVVRGTVCLKGEPDEKSLSNLYDALENLVENTSDLFDCGDAQVIRLKDRYQSPAGGYRDFLMNLKLRNFICELQVNFESALEQKSSKDHVKYEFDRMARGNLLDAAMRGDATAVNVALSTGISVAGLKDFNGITPLAYAAMYGSVEMTEALLASGADPFAIDDVGWLPVQYALSKGLRSVAGKIIDAMGKKDLSNTPNRLGPALCAAWSMVLADHSLKKLEDKTWKLVEEEQPKDAIWLIYAASLGDYRACKNLFTKKEVKTAHFRFRFEPDTGQIAGVLDCAVLAGASPKLLKFLVKDHGVPFVQGRMHDNPQEAAIHYATNDQEASVRALMALDDIKPKLHVRDGEVWRYVDYGDKEWKGSPLNFHKIALAALKARRSKVLRGMFQNGFTFKKSCEDLEAEFVSSAGRGSVEMCELLIDLGVDINAVSQAGETALSAAAFTGELGVVKFLVKCGADVDKAGPPHMFTAAHNAARTGRCDILEFLFKAGANLKAENYAGSTPEGRAKNANKTAAKELIKKLLKGKDEPEE